jgi:hypothetical protein
MALSPEQIREIVGDPRFQALFAPGGPVDVEAESLVRRILDETVTDPVELAGLKGRYHGLYRVQTLIEAAAAPLSAPEPPSVRRVSRFVNRPLRG